MTIIDLKITDNTKNYKYFYVQYTNWWDTDDMKIRHGFVQKKTNDCFWDNTGDRLIARTERAVLAWVERVEGKNPIALRTPGGGISTDKRMVK